MKVPHVIAEIVSEFSGFQHTPDFKASRSVNNFDEDPDASQSGGPSEPHHEEHHHKHHNHHESEHHGHSLYFGKLMKKSHPPIPEVDSETISNHSGGSKHSSKHGLTVTFANFFHIGHHGDHEEHHHHQRSASGASTPVRKNSNTSLPPQQKHSIHITVGADEVPVVLATPPNEPHHPHFVRNSVSPCISRVASYTSLKEKLHKIKRTTSSDSETDFPDKKTSVTSYRVVGMSN